MTLFLDSHYHKYLLFSCFCYHIILLSFPTRRSSDLGHTYFFSSSQILFHFSRFALRVAKYSSLLSSSAGVILLAPDRKSTRLNSSHLVMSYAVFCLKNKVMIQDTATVSYTC